MLLYGALQFSYLIEYLFLIYFLFISTFYVQLKCIFMPVRLHDEFLVINKQQLQLYLAIRMLY